MFDALSETKSNTNFTNEELLNNLLQKEVTIQEAKKLGIIVSKEEVEAVIEYQRDLLYNPDYVGDNKELIQEIMKER